MPARETARGRALCTLAACLGFGIAYTQLPLYSANQHTKFLHGLANAGFGLLRDDWTASTADPLPLFSALVAGTHRVGADWLFYADYLLLLGVYLRSLTEIATHAVGPTASREQRLALLAMLFLVHSAVPRQAVFDLLGFNLLWHLHCGVADQYLLGVVFQPCNFGVLLLASILAFLRGRDVLAVVCLALAASFHPAYLISAAVLTLAYVVARLRQGASIGATTRLALLSLLLVLPVFAHDLLLLRPSDPEAWHRAREIITKIRIPQHTDPHVWLNASAALKIVLMAVAAVMVRGHAELGPVLAIPLAVAATSTIYRLFVDDESIGFLGPWRMSAFLVPLSTTLIAARIAEAFGRRLAAASARHRRWAASASLSILVLCIVAGALRQRELFAARSRDEAAAALRYVAETLRPGDVYLAPADMEQFRLSTGAPTVASFKTHPYRDFEVLDWYERLQLVRTVYDPREPSRCAALAAAVARYHVTHLLMPRQGLEACEAVEKVHSDPHYEVYRLRGSH